MSLRASRAENQTKTGSVSFPDPHMALLDPDTEKIKFEKLFFKLSFLNALVFF
jgi:hypothetical protein